MGRLGSDERRERQSGRSLRGGFGSFLSGKRLRATLVGNASSCLAAPEIGLPEVFGRDLVARIELTSYFIDVRKRLLSGQLQDMEAAVLEGRSLLRVPLCALLPEFPHDQQLGETSDLRLDAIEGGTFCRPVYDIAKLERFFARISRAGARSLRRRLFGA